MRGRGRPALIVRNVHREPVGAYVDFDDLTDDCKGHLVESGDVEYDDLTDECKEELEPECITDVEGIAIIHSIFGIE